MLTDTTYTYALGTGPARHIYRLTDNREEHLREWHVVLDNLARSMVKFVDDVRMLKPAD
ncbi:MAG TPA: hypothetical protein VHV83_06155 [Armatimonadota bacterium]|nr:hypothetical protein [Armatimonadota bacterium]